MRSSFVAKHADGVYDQKFGLIRLQHTMAIVVLMMQSSSGPEFDEMLWGQDSFNISKYHAVIGI